MRYLKIIFVILAIPLLIISTIFFKSYYYKFLTSPKIIINNQAIFVDVADSQEERTQGLSGVQKLADNRGKLFIFDKSANYGFWMKDMKFNLDFIYINDDIIVDLVSDVPYPKMGEQPQTVISKSNFDKVLEINSGLINRYKFEVGQKVSFYLR